MYLHIGNSESIKKSEIIGIFDLDTATVSGVTKKYIEKMQKEGKVEYNDTDLPRTFIIVKNKKSEKIKLSRISALSLIQRTEAEY
jgi:hypothetical protein